MWQLLAQVGTMLYTQHQNKKATDQANKASREALAAETAAVNEYIRSNYEGMLHQQQQLEQIRQENAPGLAFLRRMVGGSTGLTDAQRAELDDVRRTTRDRIVASGYGASGRTAAAMFKDVENDYILRALDSNRQNAQSAAQSMANVANNAAARKVDASREYYDNYGRAVTGLGRAQGDSIRQQGENIANTTIANASLTGQAIGDIAGNIATSQQEPRRSRFADLYG